MEQLVLKTEQEDNYIYKSAYWRSNSVLDREYGLSTQIVCLFSAETA